MVNIYAAHIIGLPDPEEVPEIMEGLSRDRKEKILRFKQGDARKQSLGASLLLKQVLARYGLSLEQIRYTENGKPEIDGIYFNLSHSHEIAVCAVSDRPIGCDVEKIKEGKTKIAKRFFSSNENEYLNHFEGEEQIREFFRIWTMKESYLKMTGEGISLALNRIEFDIGERVKVYRDGALCDCEIKEYDISGYKLSVCGEEKDFAETIEYMIM